MSSIPRAAALRQQGAQLRQQRIQTRFESNAQQERENEMFPNRGGPRVMPRFQAQPRFATTNRYAARPDRSADFITAKELQEAMEEHHDSGKGFRRVFFVVLVALMAVMLFQKYDTEMNLEVPLLDDGSGDRLRFPEASTASSDGGASAPKANSGAGTTTAASAAELEELYNVLGVKGRLKPQAAAATGAAPSKSKRTEADATSSSDSSSSSVSEAEAEAKARAEADKERRRENYRVRQEMKRAYEQHLEGYGQLVSCGRNCEAKHQQVELAYNALASKVDRELYGVLLDATNSREKRSVSSKELREAYERKKAEIELTEEEGTEDRAMALEELKDAYEILENPEARTYYHLYGAKPPAMMKKVSARHGGWGAELMLGTYKYRIINAWLDYLGSSWAELAILLVLVGLVASRIPASIKQATALIEAMEDEDAMDRADKANQQQAAAAAAAAAEAN